MALLVNQRYIKHRTRLTKLLLRIYRHTIKITGTYNITYLESFIKLAWILCNLSSAIYMLCFCYALKLSWHTSLISTLYNPCKDSQQNHIILISTFTCMTYRIIDPHNIISSPSDICYNSLSSMNDTLLVTHWPSSLFYHEQLLIQWWLMWHNFQYSTTYLLTTTHIYPVSCTREIWMNSNCLHWKYYTLQLHKVTVNSWNTAILKFLLSKNFIDYFTSKPREISIFNHYNYDIYQLHM